MKPLDADVIAAGSTPLTHQQAHEIPPLGHFVRMPIALSEVACRESVDVIRRNELHVRFVAERVVDAPPARA